MYTRLGLHELKPIPDDLLLSLNPQIVVTVGTYEHSDAINRHLARVWHLKELLPNTLIAVRWWKDDHILHRMRKEEFARAFFPLHVDGTLLMVGNEDPNDPSNIAVFRDTINKHIQLMRMATEAGVTIGTCCVATGNPAQNQYKMLAPLFEEMSYAEQRGVTHWWRPNAYFTNGDYSHVNRHYNAAVETCRAAGINMPPMFLGELGFVRNFASPLDGYHSVGMSDDDYIHQLNSLDMQYPAAIYAYGDGVYDTRWKEFNTGNEFILSAAKQFARTPKTAYEEWSGGKTRLAQITSVKADYVNVREEPTMSSRVQTTLRAGDKIVYDKYSVIDALNRRWHKLTFPVYGYLASWVAKIVDLKSGSVKRTTANIVNIRKDGTTASEIIGVLRVGDYVEYEENAKTDAGGRFWHRLVSPQSGYIAAWVLEIA